MKKLLVFLALVFSFMLVPTSAQAQLPQCSQCKKAKKKLKKEKKSTRGNFCLLYTSPSPRDA